MPKWLGHPGLYKWTQAKGQCMSFKAENQRDSRVKACLLLLVVKIEGEAVSPTKPVALGSCKGMELDSSSESPGKKKKKRPQSC